MPNVKKFIGYDTTAKTVYGIIERQIDLYRLDDADGSFVAAPIDPYVSFSEHSILKGEYDLSESRTIWNDGLYKCTVYEQVGVGPVPASDTPIAFQYMYIKSDSEVVNEADIATIYGKLPTNYIMGSSVQTDKDDYIDAILVDTNFLNDTKIPDTLSLANINAQCDTAFIDYDPPTRTEATFDKDTIIAEVNANETKIDIIDTNIDTINAHLIIRQKAINDITPTTLKFDTTLAEATNNYWNNGAILFTSGVNLGVIRSIKDYDGTTKEITLNTALPLTPSDGDTFSVIMARAFKLAGLEAQEIRDAMKLAPTTGVPDTGSIDEHLDNTSLETNIETHVTNSLNSYDPPTRAELTTDKNSIIAEVNTNETKIDTVQADLNILTGSDGVTLATLQPNYAPNKVIPDAAGTAAALHVITDGKLDTLLSRISASIATALTKIADVAIAGTETTGSLLRLFYDRITGLVALDLTVAKDATVAKTDGAKGTDAIYDEVITHPTLTEIEASTSLAKEATLSNVTYGLAALKSLIDAIDTSTELQAKFTEIKGVGWTTETLKEIKDNLSRSGLTAQQVRDSMKLSPSTGIPDLGSIDAHLDTIESQISDFPTSVEIAGEMITALQTMETGDGANEVNITLYLLSTTTPISSVVIQVWNSDQTLIMASGNSDVLGKCVFALDNGTYKIRMRKVGYNFTIPETLVVSGNTNKIYYGDVIAIGEPAIASSCRVYEYLYNANDVTIPDSSVIVAKAYIKTLPYDYNGKLHIGSEVSGIYDNTTGLVYWDLVWGAKVQFTINNFFSGVMTKIIPSQSTVRLSEI